MKTSLIIGLTGQTGAGKSTVAKLFAQRGFTIIDADLCAREVVEPESPCLKKIADAFGDPVINQDGTLKRHALGQIVFSNPDKLHLLNSIMNSYIIDSIKEKISANDNRYILLDAPTLFESNADSLCDKTIALTADERIRLSRIIERDSLDRQSAADRINSQNNDDYYISRCDYSLINNSSEQALAACVNELIDKIIESGERNEN